MTTHTTVPSSITVRSSTFDHETNSKAFFCLEVVHSTAIVRAGSDWPGLWLEGPSLTQFKLKALKRLGPTI